MVAKRSEMGWISSQRCNGQVVRDVVTIQITKPLEMGVAELSGG